MTPGPVALQTQHTFAHAALCYKRRAAWGIRSWAFAIAMAGFLWSGAFERSVMAHPFHISIAEMEWNPETQRLEVSLKMHAADLERALAGIAGRQVNVEKHAISEWVESYLDQHFYVVDRTAVQKDSGGQKKVIAKVHSKSKMIGHEMEASWIWLYFEMQLVTPKGKQAETPALPKLAIVNRVLLDLIDKQINTVSVRSQGERKALRMTRAESWHPYPFEQLVNELPAAGHSFENGPSR